MSYAMTLEETEITHTACDCCGKTTVHVTGDLFYNSNWVAFYDVTYTPAHPERYALFTLGTGDWSKTAPADQRWVFGAYWSVTHRAFMLRDMLENRAYGDASYINRADILGTPFAEEAFAMLDAFFLQDSRLKDLHP